MKIKLLDYGSVWLARTMDDEAVQWLNSTAPSDALFFGGALVIEPRYVSGFVDAAVEAGAEII